MDNSGEISTSGGSGDVNSTATDYWYSHYKEFDISSSSTNEISTAGQLAYLAYMVNSGNTYSGYVFQLTADLDLSAYYWVPIGGHDTTCSTASTSYYFAGEFDGNGHTISGLDTSYADTTSSTYSNMGLFGCVYYCTLYNLDVQSSTILGYNCVGNIVGHVLHSAEISNCGCNGVITGNYYIGGISGYTSYNIYISSSFSSGIVSGTSYIGGILGYTPWGGTICNCYNYGSVSGASSYVGGIAGYFCAGEGSGYMYNCYSTAAKNGSSYVGGIQGYSDSHCYTYNCFNLGEVSGSSYVGGVVGYNEYNKAAIITDDGKESAGASIEEDIVTIEDSGGSGGKYYCYYGGDCAEIGGIEETDYSGKAEYLSDIATLAKTESWYSDSSYWSSSYEWDFDSIWLIDASYNDGYPILRWQWESPYTYDEDGDFWYFEDGYIPQSVYGTDGQTAPSDVDASAASEAYTIRLSTSRWAQVEIFAGTDEDYAFVTIYSGENVEVASAWFVVEPIVWIVAYGEDAPTDVTSAVTAQIVTAGYVYSNAGTSFSWAMSSVLGMSVETLESYMGLTYASVGDFAYDSFSGTLSQLAVTDDATTLSSNVAVSSVDEIDALGGSYASACTDFVAFLLSGGTSTDGESYSADYWTRDLAATLDDSSTYCTEFDLDSYTSVVQLNNGVYVTASGTLNNAKLNTLLGARLTMNV